MLAATLLITSLALSAPLDEAEWLSRLELSRVFKASAEPNFDDVKLGIEYFELGFPEDPKEMIRDAEERHAAGEAPARLLHQTALGFAGLEDDERAWRVLLASLDAYEEEIEAEPDDFELRMYCAAAFQTAGAVSGSQEFFERMEEEYEAAAELAPDDYRPGAQCARAEWKRWMLGKSRDVADDEWIEEGGLRAEQALEAAPTAAGGYWWRFFLKMWRARVIDTEATAEEQQERLLAAVQELLEGSEEVEDGGRLRFAAHYYSATLKLMDIADGQREAQRAEYLEAISAHVEGMLESIEAFAGNEEVTRGAALICWAHDCATGDGEDWQESFARVEELGLEREIAFGMAAVLFQKQDQPQAAARFAELLEGVLETDMGRASLVTYRYRAGDLEGALELALEYEEVTPNTEIQRAVLLLRTGEREAALELLEELAEERDDEGNLYHALGVARALAGELEGAVNALETAIELLEDGEEAERTLDEVRERLEDDEARNCE
jgi:tetratricopeptide (TPR) repeat protein